MKRMLLAAFMLASTLGVGHAQTQTFHFGEGQTGMPGGSPQSASPTARPAPARRPHPFECLPEDLLRHPERRRHQDDRPSPVPRVGLVPALCDSQRGAPVAQMDRATVS